MTNDAVAPKHLAELIRNSSKLYGLIAELETLVPDEAQRADMSPDVAGIVEFGIWQELHPAAEKVKDCLGIAVAGIPPLSPAETVSAWREALEAGLPSRRSCVMVYETYADWLNAIPETARRAIANGIPTLAAFLADFGAKRLPEVIETLASFESHDSAKRLMTSLKLYEETDASILLGALRVSSALIKAGDTALLEELEKTVTIEEMMESHDACRLLPELGHLVQEVEPLGDGMVAIVVDAIVSTAKQNVSSAFAATRSLRGLPDSMSDDVAAACVRAIARILKTAGNRALGACARRLPKLYARHGIGKMDAFIEAAADVSTLYGTTAGIRFLERRTAAAREMLA